MMADGKIALFCSDLHSLWRWNIDSDARECCRAQGGEGGRLSLKGTWERKSIDHP